LINKQLTETKTQTEPHRLLGTTTLSYSHVTQQAPTHQFPQSLQKVAKTKETNTLIESAENEKHRGMQNHK
jgi:hypothetical protein